MENTVFFLIVIIACGVNVSESKFISKKKTTCKKENRSVESRAVMMIEIFDLLFDRIKMI